MIANWMLEILTKGAFFRLALWIAGLAAFALVAPPVALAFAPAERAAHCLTHVGHEPSEDEGTVDAGHSHGQDHTSHLPKQTEHKSSCCGIFCVIGIAPDIGAALQPHWAGVPITLSFRPPLHGQPPEQPDRPPISRLSF